MLTLVDLSISTAYDHHKIYMYDVHVYAMGITYV